MPESNERTNEQRCQKCGSMYFVEGEFKRYQAQYSSSPGADASPMDPDPIRALVCMCGQSVPLGPLRRRSITLDRWTSFQKSQEAARRYRDSWEPSAITETISANLVSQEAYQGLADQISALERILQLRIPDPDSPAQDHDPDTRPD